MRRFTIGSAMVLALLLMLTAIATAAPPSGFCGDEGTNPDHPSCATPTPPPSEPECIFDADGVLQGWPETNSYRCEWTVADPAKTVSFELWSPDGSVTSVKLAHLIVNEDIVFPSDICFHDTRNGPQDLPFPGDDLWTFSPEGRGCGEGPYLLTISVQKITSGVELVMK